LGRKANLTGFYCSGKVRLRCEGGTSDEGEPGKEYSASRSNQWRKHQGNYNTTITSNLSKFCLALFPSSG